KPAGAAVRDELWPLRRGARNRAGGVHARAARRGHRPGQLRLAAPVAVRARFCARAAAVAHRSVGTLLPSAAHGIVGTTQREVLPSPAPAAVPVLLAALRR